MHTRKVIMMGYTSVISQNETQDPIEGKGKL
jgi:hypothetical protein